MIKSCPVCGGNLYQCNTGDIGCQHCDTCCAVLPAYGAVQVCGDCDICTVVHYRCHGEDFSVCGATVGKMSDREEEATCPSCVEVNKDARSEPAISDRARWAEIARLAGDTELGRYYAEQARSG